MSWFSAIRSGNVDRVRDLLSRRGASAHVALSNSDDFSEIAASHYDPSNIQITHTLPGKFPRILRGRRKSLKTLDHRFGFGQDRLSRHSYKKSPGKISEYFWLPGGIDCEKIRTHDTAAHVCATRGFCETLNLLINEGCNILKSNNSGSTPLHCAAKNGHLHIVQLIVDALRNTTTQSKKNLNYNIITKNNASLNIEDGYNDDNDRYDNDIVYRAMSLKNSAGDTPLAVAARYGHHDVLHLLCQIGGETIVQCKNNMGETPLELSTRNGFDKCVEILLNNGAFANGYKLRRTLNGHLVPNADPLLWACRGTNPRVVTLLRKAGANVNPSHLFESVKKHTKSPYMRDQILPILLMKNLNEIQSDGENKEEENMRYSMKKAISVAILSNREDIAFALCNQIMTKKDDLLYHFITAPCSKSNTSLLHLSSSYGHSSVVQLLIQMGSNVNDIDPSTGNTPMHKAINDVCIEMLLANGGNINAENDEMNTSLHFACRRGDFKTVQLLVNNNAFINTRNVDGCTPLAEAVRCAPMAQEQQESSGSALKEHVLIVNLLTPLDHFAREPVDQLKNEVRVRDRKIKELETRIREITMKAEEDMLRASNIREELKKSSTAVLFCFNDVINDKSFKDDNAIPIVESYQNIMNEKLEKKKKRKEKEQQSTVQSILLRKKKKEEEVKIQWPGIKEFSIDAVYVNPEIPSKKANQRPKRKPKKTFKKEKAELSKMAMLGASQRLQRLIDLD